MTSLKELQNMHGRVVVITGAAGHIGRVIARTLAELGAFLVLLDRDYEGLKSLEAQIEGASPGQCACIECDISDENARREAVGVIQRQYGSCSCLINNAAYGGDAKLTGWREPLGGQSLDSWRAALEVNLTAPFHFSQHLAGLLKASTGGNIINIASIYGSYGPDWSLYEGTTMGNPAAYGASKAGLIQLTRYLATYLAPSVRVNAISPGGIFRMQDKRFVDRYEAKVPLRRMGSEGDLMGAISYLATDLSSYVTGEIIEVSGGFGIW